MERPGALRGALARTLLLLEFAALGCAYERAPASAPMQDAVSTPDHIGSPRYRIELSPDLATASVALCFEESLPKAIRFIPPSSSPSQVPMVDSPHLRLGGGRRAPLEPSSSSGWSIPNGLAPQIPCIHYSLDLSRLVAAKNGLGRVMVVDPELILAWPVDRRSRKDAYIELRHSEGIRWLGPAERVKRSHTRTEIWPANRPRTWRAAWVIGEFERMEVKGAWEMEFAFLNPPTEAHRSWAKWFASLPQHWPDSSKRRLQIVIHPSGWLGEAFSYGNVFRGHGDLMNLYVDPGASLDELTAHWVPPHELTHVFMPCIEPGNAWLNEGIATYYQEVLRARAGVLSREDAWRRLTEGFARGKASRADHASLAQLAENMHQEGAYVRVYWAGAALALNADVASERRLDVKIAQASSELEPVNRFISPEEFLESLEPNGPSPLSHVAATWLKRSDFPEVRKTLKRLGLRPDGSIVRGENAEARRLRCAIMGCAHLPSVSDDGTATPTRAQPR